MFSLRRRPVPDGARPDWRPIPAWSWMLAAIGVVAVTALIVTVGLMQAFRRQHHQEIATVLTDLDATERRITELYTKAVEQLGSVSLDLSCL